MNTATQLFSSLLKKMLLSVVVLAFFGTATLPVSGDTSLEQKQQIVRKVAQRWISIGKKQCENGLFMAAEKSFLLAKDYEPYLDDAELTELENLLNKTRTAASDKKQKQLQKQKEQINKLYNQSVQLYKQGQVEQARQGFLTIAKSGLSDAPAGKTAEDYLASIDASLAEQVSPAAAVETEKIVGVEEQPLTGEEKDAEQPRYTAAEPVKKPAGYIEVINRKRNILQSHTKAVVNDAISKAEKYLSQNEFAEAQKAVEKAERTVNKNQLHLGKELFERYRSQLYQLSEQIKRTQQQQARQAEEQKRSDAIQAQRDYRDQMERDRAGRVRELTANAEGYQKQQRYEEALGQLESLLAIEPMNERAMILKQTLEDTINFRKQLEVQKEKRKERVKSLLETQKSMIPYAEELTYPKNWREIDASPFRQPEGPMGQDPANVRVYEQLDEIVDLSQFTPEMTVREAIEELKNSVEPPLKMSVRWKDLYDNADIDEFTPINMDPIAGISLSKALSILLNSVAGGFVELGYVVDDGVITIATVDTLPSELETLVYDVSDLLGRPAEFFASSGGGGGGAGEEGIEGFEEQDQSADELTEEATERAENLVLLIQDTLEPDSWYDYGGEGTIRVYENKKLIVRQNRKIHKRIDGLLTEMRKSLGHQVAIEARFLLVGENFLEDIGLDIDMYHKDAYRIETTFEGQEYREAYGDVIINPDTGYPYTDGDPEWVEFSENDWAHWEDSLLNPLREIIRLPIPDTGEMVQTIVRDYDKFSMMQSHREQTWPRNTEVPGSLVGGLLGGVSGLNMGIGGIILDTLQVNLMLRATQAHRDATSITAPKVSVLSGEMASFQVQRVFGYATEIEIDFEEIGDFGAYRTTVDHDDAWITTGTVLNVSPTITQDKKNVLLHISTEMVDFLGYSPYTIQVPILGVGVGGGIFTILYPDTEVSRIQTRVLVPDGGTLLLGGQKVTVQEEIESGVPILSKIPFIGRAFSNRSKVEDEKILLILVQPTIMLQEETESRALAVMD